MYCPSKGTYDCPMSIEKISNELPSTGTYSKAPPVAFSRTFPYFKYAYKAWLLYMKIGPMNHKSLINDHLDLVFSICSSLNRLLVTH